MDLQGERTASEFPENNPPEARRHGARPASSSASSCTCPSGDYNRSLFQLSPLGLALCRMDGTLVDVNPAYAAILGRTVEETLRLKYWDVTPREYEAGEHDQLELLKRTGRYGPYEKEYLHTDGHRVPVRLSGRLMEMNGTKFIWSNVEDLSQLKTAERSLQRAYDDLEVKIRERTHKLEHLNERLRRAALMDPLTGLLNRRGLQEMLTRLLPRNPEAPGFLALLIDLDDFKRINDTWGHAVGDIALTELAGALKASLRQSDIAARIGGDEFMILLTDTRLAEGVVIAEKIRMAISGNPVITLTGEAVHVTASLSLLEITDAVSTIDELLVETCQALFRSKRDGKNQLYYYDKTGFAGGKKDESASARLVNELLSHDNFRVVKQPLVRLSDGAVVGYEFLSRSHSAGFESPLDFFRVALQNNILTAVDHQCLRLGVEAAAAMGQDLRYHLNLFPSTLIDIAADQLFGDWLASNPPGSFCIEISEQQIIGDPSYLVEKVQMLKKMGFLIAIDDVGFGRSCFESLVLLDPDLIKIDKRCIQGLATDPSRLRSLKRMLNVARSLNTTVIAEGIETREDLEALRALDVPYGQGYLFDGTLSAAEIIAGGPAIADRRRAS